MNNIIPKVFVGNKINTHMKCERSITPLMKVMANVKCFADRQTDRQADKAKTICLQICSCSGIKFKSTVKLIQKSSTMSNSCPVNIFLIWVAVAA